MKYDPISGLDMAPCPFCGRDEQSVVERDEDGRAYVWCEPCEASGPTAFVRSSNREAVKKAVAEWNRRDSK